MEGQQSYCNYTSICVPSAQSFNLQCERINVLNTLYLLLLFLPDSRCRRTFLAMRTKITDVLVLCQLCFTGLAAVTPDVSILHTLDLTSVSHGKLSKSLE